MPIAGFALVHVCAYLKTLINVSLTSLLNLANN